MDHLPKRQRLAILVLAFCIVLKPDPAWANAAWVFLFPFVSVIIAVPTFFLLVLLEGWILSYVFKVAFRKAFRAAFYGNLASAIVGLFLPTTIHFGDALIGFIASTSAASILAARVEFVVVAAVVSTLVEFPIFHLYTKGHWSRENDRLAKFEMIAVLAMNLLTTVLLIVFAVGVNRLVNSVADKIGQ